MADFNGDGRPDVAVFQRTVGGSINRYVQFLAGNGDGSFTPTYDFFRFEKPTPPQFGIDLNGDGIADLMELDSWTSSFSYLPGAPAPPFQIGLLAEPVVGTGQLQITMDVPSASATNLVLSASDPNILLPSSLTIPAGVVAQVVSFTFAPGFNKKRTFSITTIGLLHCARVWQRLDTVAQDRFSGRVTVSFTKHFTREHHTELQRQCRNGRRLHDDGALLLQWASYAGAMHVQSDKRFPRTHYP